MGETHPKPIEVAAYEHLEAVEAQRDAALADVARLTSERDEAMAALARCEEETGLMLCPMGCGCRVGTADADAADCACNGPCCWDDLREWAEDNPAAYASITTAELGATDGE